MARNVMSPYNQSNNAIAKAEGDIAQCLADFVCAILDEIKEDCKLDPEEKVALFVRLITAATDKENAIAAVINALAKKIAAEKDKGDAPPCPTDD